MRGQNGLDSICKKFTNILGPRPVLGDIDRTAGITFQTPWDLQQLQPKQRPAGRHARFVEAEWARDAVEEILDTDDLNFQARLVTQVLADCQYALADKRIAD